MAEFQLSIKYTSPTSQSAMRCLALLFPVWGVIAPSALLLFIVLLLRLPAHISLVHSLAIIAVLLSFIALSAFLAVYYDDDQIKINKDGLAFPLRFWRSLQNKSEFKWAELTSLKLNWHRQEKFAPDETLTLAFSNGGYCTLQLALLDPKQLEQFFVAFEACAFKCERDAELEDFESAVQNRDKKLGQKSFTELWDQTLSLQFNPATFTPLEPDALLQEGRYQVLRQLSFGGFAAVYLARSSSGGFVVLKESCLPQAEDVQSKANEFFKRESSLLAKIDHPNIVKVLDHFAQSGRQYIVLEHLRGIDLGRYVRESGVQNEATVLNFAGQIVEALQYLHSQSPPIVHRDITPDNLLLRPDGKLMLIDFGAAKEIAGSFTGTIIGKQAYMAPEQFKGKPRPASDIYGLGATLYYLTTGRAPEVLAQSTIMEGEGDSSDKKKLATIIAKCTDIDADKRCDASALISLLAETPTAIEPAQLAEALPG